MSATNEIILEQYQSLKKKIEEGRQKGEPVVELEAEASRLAAQLSEGSKTLSEGKRLLKD